MQFNLGHSVHLLSEIMELPSFMLMLSTVLSVQPDCTEDTEPVSDDDEP